jgi:acyl-CoA dehydrogenase
MTSDYVSPWMTDELRAVQDTTRRFLLRDAVPNMPKWSEQRFVDKEFWLAAGELGLLCPTVPERFGGPGGTILHQIAITEEQSRVMEKGWGNNVHSGVVTDYLLKYGTEEQCLRWLPDMVAGRRIGAIAMTEPGAGSDVRAMVTRARRVSNEYVIDGTKTFITNGLTADLVIVAVKVEDADDPKAITLVMVEAGSEGFHRGQALRKIGQHAADTAELFFDGCRVPVANRIGDEGAGFPALMAQMPQERLILAVNAVVQAEKAVALTVEYTKQRRVFGKPLFEQQNTRFVLAECRTLATVARQFLDQCIVAHAEARLDNATAAMAKWWVSDMQCRVLDECVQLWGGYGYMEEYPIARMYADARVQKVYGGANEVMKEIIARTL